MASLEHMCDFNTARKLTALKPQRLLSDAMHAAARLHQNVTADMHCDLECTGHVTNQRWGMQYNYRSLVNTHVSTVSHVEPRTELSAVSKVRKVRRQRCRQLRRALHHWDDRTSISFTAFT